MHQYCGHRCAGNVINNKPCMVAMDPSPDLNLTPLAAFYVFAERSEGQIELCLKSGGGLQRQK